jgi:hypothetical protein
MYLIIILIPKNFWRGAETTYTKISRIFRIMKFVAPLDLQATEIHKKKFHPYMVWIDIKFFSNCTSIMKENKKFSYIFSSTKSFIAVFEVLTGVIMKSSIFWDITPRSLIKVNWCFRGTCHLHPQGWSWTWRSPPKRRLTFSYLHGIVYQKTELIRTFLNYYRLFEYVTRYTVPLHSAYSWENDLGRTYI